MNETDIAYHILNNFCHEREVPTDTYDDETNEEIYAHIKSTRTFKEAGLITIDQGVEITMADGSEYQITVKRSRYGRESI